MRKAVSIRRAGGVRSGQPRSETWPAASRFFGVAAACLVLLACSEGVASPARMPAASPSPPEHAPIVTGEVTISFKPGVPADERERFLREKGLTVVRRHFLASDVTVGVPAGRESALSEEFRAAPEVVAAAEVALQFPLDAPEPNDPIFYAQRWNFSLVQAQEAWQKTRGAGVIVAVVDTGVAFENYSDPVANKDFVKAPDFASAHFVYPRNEVTGTVHPNDDWGHGTHVAGTIAEATNNGLEAAGIASDALIMPVKACGFQASGQYGCDPNDVGDAIDWATTHGADVINLSLGGPSGNIGLERPAIERALSAGIVVVAAAGNGGPDQVGDPQLYYPAALPGVIAVGATDSSGARAGYSNYGSSPEDPTRMLDLVAPGGDARDFSWVVQNTFIDFCSGKLPTDAIDYTKFASCGVRGTSQATPHVSAVAALIRSLQPDLRADKVVQLLQCSANDLGPGGFDPEYGHGMVQAFEAMRDTDGNGQFDCLDTPKDTCGVAGSPTPTLIPTQAAGENGMPTPVTTPTLTPSPTDTPTPTPTDTPTPTPTDSPTPTPTNSPTPTP
ncbi:MAG TPA: S8 family serine peptidase, partial [Dehalococcoidia bacterium]|nr:S8 family serine peptidase [Dehalococcoidia bacterium]